MNDIPKPALISSQLAELEIEEARIAEQAASIAARRQELLAEGRPKALEEVRRLVVTYGITVAELQQAALPESNAVVVARGSAGATTTSRLIAPARNSEDLRKVVKPKYRSPDGIHEWCGRGLTPMWMRTLLQAGRTKDEFLIAGDCLRHPPLTPVSTKPIERRMAASAS